MGPAQPPTVLTSTAIQDQLIASYGELRAELLRFLAARLGNMAAAEDVYQGLYLRLHGAVPTAELRDARSFIYRSTYNLANEQVRAHRRRRPAALNGSTRPPDLMGGEAIAPERAADEALAAKQRLQAVAKGISGLPPRCREVFTLCRVHGLGHREVAENIGISIKAPWVASFLHGPVVPAVEQKQQKLLSAQGHTLGV